MNSFFCTGWRIYCMHMCAFIHVHFWYISHFLDHLLVDTGLSTCFGSLSSVVQIRLCRYLCSNLPLIPSSNHRLSSLLIIREVTWRVTENVWEGFVLIFNMHIGSMFCFSYWNGWRTVQWISLILLLLEPVLLLVRQQGFSCADVKMKSPEGREST